MWKPAAELPLISTHIHTYTHAHTDMNTAAQILLLLYSSLFDTLTHAHTEEG